MPAPVCEQIDAIAKDANLGTGEKHGRIMAMRGEACLAAMRALRLPYTIRRNTRLGELSLTIEAADHVMAGDALLRNTVRLRIAVSLAGEPAAIDPDRIFVNPPLRDIVQDGDNETKARETDPDGVERLRTYRWREDPAGVILRELMRQVVAELRA